MNQVAIFQTLDENQMNLLRPLFEPFSCRVGTVILEQGAAADSLYLLLSGTVEIFFKPYDGSRITVSHVEKGGLFGWSAVIGREKYTSSAIAIEDVEAFRVRGTDLRKFCLENPEAGKDILERLADSVTPRWNDAQKQVTALLVQGILARSEVI
jgi:CRP/FNR family transcriptional regulator, cyclic AMP receptor protein